MRPTENGLTAAEFRQRLFLNARSSAYEKLCLETKSENSYVPVDPTRIIAIIREMEQTPYDELKEMDRELLLSIKQTLQEHRREVDKILLRLAFVDEQQLN